MREGKDWRLGLVPSCSGENGPATSGPCHDFCWHRSVSHARVRQDGHGSRVEVCRMQARSRVSRMPKKKTTQERVGRLQELVQDGTIRRPKGRSAPQGHGRRRTSSRGYCSPWVTGHMELKAAGAEEAQELQGRWTAEQQTLADIRQVTGRMQRRAVGGCGGGRVNTGG